MYETANGNLKALWKEFYVALKADMNAAATTKDRAFAQAADKAVDVYKNNFGGNESDLLADYSKINKLVSSNNYQLRYNKSWFDKYVKMSNFTSRTPSTNPSQWSSSDIVYLIGIMPAALRKDMNMTIRSSYLYGYMNQAAIRGISASANNHYSSLRPRDLSWDTYIDDGYYYDNIYDSSYLVNDLSNTFREMSIRTGNTDRYLQACKKALKKMESCEERARRFKDENNLKRDKKGKMEFTGSKGDWNKLDSAYTDICNDMKVAMKEFTTNWANFAKAFPGVATSDFGKAMDDAFDNYYRDFVYAPVDTLDARYEALRTRSAQFKLERVTSSMFTGAIDKSLYSPSSFRKPRKALYSAQRVISFLPPEIKTVLDSRRQKAYRNGAAAAESEYRREQARIERERAAAAAANNSGTSGWNDNSGSNWNDNNNNSGSDWNNNSSTNTNSSDWNNNTPPADNSWNDSNSGTNTDTGSSDWNTGDAADNNSADSWNDNSGSTNNGW